MKGGGKILEVIFIKIIFKTVILDEIPWGESVNIKKGWVFQNSAKRDNWGQ